MEHLYLGIDCGKNFSEAFGFVPATGEIVKRAKWPMFDERQWRFELGVLRARFVLHAAFEVGAHYDWLYDLLKEYCEAVVVVNPAAFALIAQSHKKTDALDAERLARGLWRGDLPDVYVPDKPTRADRRLVAFTHWHSQQSAALKGKLRSLLLQHRLECPFTNVLGVKALQWLEEVARPAMEAQAQLFLEMLLAQARLLQKQRVRLDQQVKERARSYAQAPQLDSVPGFGPLAILAVLSAVAEIKRFERPEQLASYFGVCGAVYQSGQTLRLGQLTKRGNVHVRWLLSQVLHHLHRKDSKARKRYERLKRRRSRGIARSAQVRWLTNVLWQLLSKNENYRLVATAAQKTKKVA